MTSKAAIAGEYRVPSSLVGAPVVKIDEAAYKDCYALKSVVVPEGVRVIENHAFMNCSALERAVFPESLGFSNADRSGRFVCRSPGSPSIPAHLCPG